MVNNNNLINLIENKKPVEIVQELKDYKIKRSSLSVAARGKVISKSGSNYLNKDREGYGPCEYSGCPYSNDTRFYLKIGFDDSNLRLKEKSSVDTCWSIFDWLTLKNVARARDALRRFEN